MGKSQIILSIGSNKDRERNMELAVELLQSLFSDIRFSERIETKPYGSLTGSAPFLNQVAIAETTLTSEEIICQIKEIEKRIGRRPEDKSLGAIPVDIDLLQWNDTVIKPDDLQREYIQSLLNCLLNFPIPHNKRH